MSECKHPKCCGCGKLVKWVNRDGSRTDKCYLDSCRHNAASEKRTKRCHYEPPAKTRPSERDSRHMAFTVRLVRGLLGYYGDPIKDFLPKHEEYDANRYGRAARRWLAVVEGKNR